ncbi:unnamed protein product (macronuclear) [Paramecium tetraurelia]|uniref:SEC7 domain-containing protein n=1 Tax=Paramecium tetraurelia TaxID=5888 RepID=A0D6X2_PARTE|nr:uncharacterized protein GSPATT00001830001 [Paramecium tetraurelia]CAK78789.1 unnamed protein product [Paramecium tetraurelia]|eukprot:XP_001446186.1 hypothetical protein (macronuclear) [Paramecium tetraurelia strain d4-2]
MNETYQNLVLQYFEKLKKVLPQKLNSYKETIHKFQGQDKSYFGDHIIAFKQGMQIKQSKIKELTLTTLITLVSKGYIDGGLQDNTENFQQSDQIEITDTAGKKREQPINVIESLIHLVQQCLVEKDEIISLALKLLISLVMNPYCNMQYHELTKVIKTIVYIYAQSKSQNIDRLCKSIFLQIILITFQGSNSDTLVKITLDNVINKVSEIKQCQYCGKEGKFECRQNKVTVCSYRCKKYIQETLELKQKNYENAQNLFDLLIRLLSPKQNQIILLEGIYFICDNYDFSVEAQNIYNLSSYLLKFCLQNEQQLYSLSFKIFQRLTFSKHKEMINQINIFINQIYISVLTNKNTTDQHKQTTLESLWKIFQRKHASLEFYLNYDCSIKHEFLMENIINTLHSIFQQNEQFRPVITQIYQAIILGIESTFNEKAISNSQQEQQQPQDIDETVFINQLEMQRQQKQEIQKGVDLFKKNPEKGVSFLIKANILQDDPASIARFLIENKSLPKESVGQYLGGHHPINIQVLSEYTNFLKFHNIIDLFTLPPESQQIDRVVQKFADKFYEDNQSNAYFHFKSSSSIYTFTYLLVMLQTDLHNPKVVEKMKLTDFIKLARQINDGEDLPSEYLTVTYHSIQKNPLAVRESNTPMNSLTPNQYQKQMEELLKKIKDLIKRQSNSNYIQIDQETILLSKGLFEQFSGKFLEILLVTYENTPNGDSLIKSILQLIKLSSKLSMKIESLVQEVIKVGLNSLKKGSTMLMISLLSTIPTIGNSLHEQGWKCVLEAVSQMDEFRLLDSDHTEKVFMCSKDLDNSSIEEFILQLCQLSKQEIIQKHRIYSLQKLVEVSDYNMDRVKVIWNRLWSIVSQHIQETVSVRVKKITIVAVDSLKQLNMKFLSKEELYNIEFQREVLKPFELIYNNSDIEEKEFVLLCVKQILQNSKTYIKSGYKVIFNLINLGLKEENDTLSKLAFDLLRFIEIQELILIDLIQTYQILGKKDNENMAINSIDFVKQCQRFMITQEQQTLQVPLLGILSNLAGDKRIQIQTQAVETLFYILEEKGNLFNEEYWIMIFSSVLRPIFDEIQFTLSTNPELNQYWFKDSCQKVFQNISSLIKKHYTKLKGQLPDFLKLFQNCIQNQNEKLAQLSIQAFKTMIMEKGLQFEQKDWELILSFIQQMLKYTIPTKLRDIDQSRQKSLQTVTNNIINECYSQCAAQLLLIQTSRDICELYHQNWSLSQLDNLEVTFYESYQFAKLFNQQIEQRYNIWKSGFMQDMNVLPGLLRQEREAFSCMIMIIQFKIEILKQEQLKVHQQNQEQVNEELQIKEPYEVVLNRYLHILLDSIKQFNSKHIQFINQQQESGEDPLYKIRQYETERDIQNLRTLLDVSILPRILLLSDQEIKLKLNEFYEQLLNACSFVSEYCILQMGCQDCKKCVRCLNQQKNNLFFQIKKCLLKLFELK